MFSCQKGSAENCFKKTDGEKRGGGGLACDRHPRAKSGQIREDLARDRRPRAKSG